MRFEIKLNIKRLVLTCNANIAGEVLIVKFKSRFFMSSDYLFIYGLLQNGFDNPFSKLVKDNSRTLGRGFVHGRLHEINGYPGLKLLNDSQEKVLGTLVQLLDQSILQQLDLFEGIGGSYTPPFEYRREIISVTLNNQLFLAWAYLYNWDVTKHKRIPGGDYLKFVKDKKQPED